MRLLNKFFFIALDIGKCCPSQGNANFEKLFFLEMGIKTGSISGMRI
jgi:hypothetical protein